MDTRQCAETSSARIAEEVRNFVRENFLFGQDGHLGPDDSFLELGIIDSTGVLELVSFLEDKFKIKVETAELTPENLDTLNRIHAYLRSKLDGGRAD